MVKLGLYLTATLENLARLEPSATTSASSPSTDGKPSKSSKPSGIKGASSKASDWPLSFTIRCSSCRSVHANPVTFYAGSEIPLPGSGDRGLADFVYSCRDCTHTNSVIVLARPDGGVGGDGAKVQVFGKEEYGWPPLPYLAPLSSSDSDDDDEVEAKGKPMSTGPQNGQRQLITLFETRGCELVDFQPGQSGSWTAHGRPKGKKAGTVYEDVDLTEGEWYEYDDLWSKEVSIQDVKFEVLRAK